MHFVYHSSAVSMISKKQTDGTNQLLKAADKTN